MCAAAFADQSSANRFPGKSLCQKRFDYSPSGEKFAFPCQCSSGDQIDVITLGYPAQYATDFLRIGNKTSRVASATWLFDHGKRSEIGTFNRTQDFAHRVTMTVCTVQRNGISTTFQIRERSDVRTCQVIDMNIVADTRAIRCRIVRAKNRNVIPYSNGSLASNFGQQSCVSCGLADPCLAIAARDIEITQRDVLRATRRRQITQHPLTH